MSVTEPGAAPCAADKPSKGDEESEDISDRRNAQGQMRQFYFPHTMIVKMREQAHIQHIITRKVLEKKNSIP